MLTHKDIKKIVLREYGRSVRRGHLYVVPTTIQARINELKTKVEGCTAKQLIETQKEIKKAVENARKGLASSTAKIQQREIVHLTRVSEKEPLVNELKDYVQWYNEFKIQTALLMEIQLLIAHPTKTRMGANVHSAHLNKQLDRDLNNLEFDNEMLLRGEFWDIRFNGNKQFHLKDRVGLHYIARLLESPNEIVGCEELAGLTEKRRLFNDPADESMPWDKMRMSSGIAFLDDKVPALDTKAFAELKKELTKIESKLAAGNLKAGEESKFEKEKELVIRHLKSAGRRNTIRPTQALRVYKAVVKAINESLVAISRNEPQLGAHFRSAIKKGQTLCYRSVANIRWKIDRGKFKK